MKHPTRLFFGSATLALVLANLIVVAASHAAVLRTADLNSPGDNLLTVDSATGLELVDPAVTSGLTYNQLVATNLVTDRGFSLATTGQLKNFLSDAGITDFSGDFNTTDEAAVENLLGNFIGQTITAPITLPPAGGRSISDGVYGFTEDPDTPAVRFNVAGLDYQSEALDQAPQDQARTILDLISFPGDSSPPNPGDHGINGSIAGGFLVRSAGAADVVEPPQLGLMAFALGLIAIAGFRRRRGSSAVES